MTYLWHIATLAFLIVCVSIVAIQADEPTMPPIPISGGLICDHIQEVTDFLDSKGTAKINGCGILEGYEFATITHLGIYETNGFQFNLVRYDFQSDVAWGNTVQYGYFGKPVDVATAI